jgi:hypothetical protein
MVNRILVFADDLAADQVAKTLDTASPRQGQTYSVKEVWTNGETDVDISLTVRERTLIDAVPIADLPSVGNGLVFDLEVNSGDELAVLGTETNGAAATPAVYVLINER